MTSEQIIALGQFIAHYHSNLLYIKNFQNFKKTEEKKGYMENREGTFYKFLIEFKIIRNLPKEKQSELLIESLTWVKNSKPHEIELCQEVDLFAKALKEKGISNKENTPLSLASKILFLDNPWKVIPYDKQAKWAVGCKERNYKEYIEKICTDELKTKAIDYFQEGLSIINPLIFQIEKEFRDIEDIETIRTNRLLDKYLWTIGLKKPKGKDKRTKK